MSPTNLPVGHGSGHVTFLGAGPGDPGLLTLRAVEALAHADVLVAEPDVLDVVRVHAPPGVTVLSADADAPGASAASRARARLNWQSLTRRQQPPSSPHPGMPPILSCRPRGAAGGSCVR